MGIMPQRMFKLNGIMLFLLLGAAVACQDKGVRSQGQWGMLVAPQDKIAVKLLIEIEDQRRGFSGTRDGDWPDDDGLLFIFPEEGPRHFWMPDTHFDLDLIYLDADFKVVDLQRDVPHFVGREPEDRVPRARETWARHVLEMKSKSKVAERIKVGDRLRFEAQEIPPQIR